MCRQREAQRKAEREGEIEGEIPCTQLQRQQCTPHSLLAHRTQHTWIGKYISNTIYIAWNHIMLSSGAVCDFISLAFYRRWHKLYDILPCQWWRWRGCQWGGGLVVVLLRKCNGTARHQPSQAAWRGRHCNFWYCSLFNAQQWHAAAAELIQS